MAIGVEKVKDSGYQGLNAFPIPNDGTARGLTAAAMFSLIVPAYSQRYGVDEDELKRVLAGIASKNHYNGARNPLAQFRKEMSEDAICAAPEVAGRLGVFDCAGVADGSAAAILVRAEDAHRYTDKPLYIKALSFVAGNGSGVIDPAYDYTSFPEVARAAAGHGAAIPVLPFLFLAGSAATAVSLALSSLGLFGIGANGQGGLGKALFCVETRPVCAAHLRALSRLSVLADGIVALGERWLYHGGDPEMNPDPATARQVIKSLDEIVWAVNPRHDTLESLTNYIARFAHDFLSTAQIRCARAATT